MPDIKNEIKIEKPVAGIKEAVKEKPAAAPDREKLKNLEQARKMVIDEIAQQPRDLAAPAAAPIGAAAAPFNKRQKQIENVLAKDLAEVYLSLPPEKQREFKRAGEETAGKINQLLARAKVKIGEIVKLIVKWLALIPGVNKYFLEQSAKIKADEIVKMNK
ncbi:MAG: hypothetical protein Q7R92_05035 [bacterium]|nr:hypothetical protein [bacterium]